ncbi:MAG: hypothetical protein JNK08_06195, partial [Sediminibacterium sp.]|nr:hypothetical protein [Sediminibacterium sp.]
MLLADATAQVTIPTGNPVGTGSNTTLTRKPYGAFFGFERTALIYLASEIGGPGQLNAIGFYLETASTPVNVPVNIHVKHTAAATFAATSTVATEQTGATLVYSGTLSGWTAGAWKTVTLTTPFTYNGTDNLEIIIESNFGGSGGEGSSAKAFRYTNQGTGVNRGQYWQADGSAPTGNGTLFIYRPNVQLTIANPCSGTPSISGATALTSSFNCSGTPQLTLTSYPLTATGITYQWQSSPAGLGTWTNVGTAQSTPVFTAPTITASTDY